MVIMQATAHAGLGKQVHKEAHTRAQESQGLGEAGDWDYSCLIFPAPVLWLGRVAVSIGPLLIMLQVTLPLPSFHHRQCLTLSVLICSPAICWD